MENLEPEVCEREDDWRLHRLNKMAVYSFFFIKGMKKYFVCCIQSVPSS